MIVALDLGGVIVDVDHQRCAAVLGRPWSECERAFFAEELHDRVTVGDVDGAAFVAAASARMGGAGGVREAWAAVVDLTPLGRALVEELLARGHAVHLWSNTDPVHLERMLGQLPEGVVVDTVSFRLGAMKPQAAFFQRALAFGAPAVFLDDRLDIIEAARAEGINARQCLGPVQARALLVEAALLPARLPS